MSTVTPPRPGDIDRAPPDVAAPSGFASLWIALEKPRVQDAGVAVLLLTTGVLGYLGRLEVDLPEGTAGVLTSELDLTSLLLIAGQTVPLAWRRTAPVLVLSLITLCLFLFFVSSYFPSLASLGFLVAVYTVAAHRDRSISVPAVVASGGLVFLMTALSREPFEFDAVIGEALVIGAAWFLGDGVRQRRGHLMLLEDRAARLEREREEGAREAVMQERRVISRELHDVVAHSVSVMVTQAGAARRVARIDPDDTVAALDTIERLGREALVEMRRLTGFLRTDTDPVTREPQPGLEDLDTLLAQVRAAGVRVTLETAGEPRKLPTALSLTAYRIVQEALTNVIKHAGSVRARVAVRYEPSALILLIEDEGRAVHRSNANPGYGHLGMRERVALFGGELTIGRRPGGGYRVSARLPIDGATR